MASDNLHMTELQDLLRSQFHENVKLKEKRPRIFQVYAPFYHEDGDMLDIYIEPVGSGFRICDYGKTLMRLSYSFDIDTDNKRRIFNELLSENRVNFDESKGNIYLESQDENLCSSLLHFSQVVAKVSRLDVLKREVISGLFYEMVEKFVSKELQEFSPELDTLPLKSREDLKVTCSFNIKPDPVHLIAVRGSAKAIVAALSFLEFQRAGLRFKGCVVHEDFDSLPSNDRTRITSAADKQFVSFEDFRENSARYLNRERMAG